MISPVTYCVHAGFVGYGWGLLLFICTGNVKLLYSLDTSTTYTGSHSGFITS